LTAECLVELGRWEEADAKAAEVLHTDPEWTTGRFIRALAAMQQGRLDDAREGFAAAYKADKTLAEAAHFLSVLADFEDDRESASRWADKADYPEPSGKLPATVAEFDDLLLEVVADYDDTTADTLDESRFRVVPMPSAAEMRDGDTTVDSWSRLDELDPEGDPPTFGLTLYFRNIVRGAVSTEEVKERLSQLVDDALLVLSEAARESVD
jgi:tetratricopeptide (TPR) repeat protein